jgi:hypothetical protein
MSPLRIFTEYDRHTKFLTDFIFVKFGRKMNSNEFIKLSGIQNIPFAQQSFLSNTAVGGNNIVILDGYFGVDKDHDKLEELKTSLGIDFDYFILPNNKDEGKLEDLLYQIIPTKYNAIKICFSDYETAVFNASLADKKSTYNLPSTASKIHAYLDVVLESKDREMLHIETRDYKVGKYWDIHSSATDPLSQFIAPHIP